MPVLSQPEVEQLARRAGFTPYNARIMGAIALCEAPARTPAGEPGANTDAVGDQDLATATWGFSYGPGQVRSLRADKGTGRWRDELRLVDPLFNMRACRAIKLAAGSFRPWTTFTSGAFKAYLQTAPPDGIGPVFPPPPGGYVVQSGDTLGGIAARVGGFTWQELARVNRIESPYRIYIGQTLVLPPMITPELT